MKNSAQIHICHHLLCLIEDLLCLDLGDVIKGRDCLRNDLRLAVALNVAQFVYIASYNKTECDTLTTCTTGTTDSMYIVLLVLRNVVVEHCLDIVDIDSSRCHIGCDKNLGATISETVHHAVTLDLL